MLGCACWTCSWKSNSIPMNSQSLCPTPTSAFAPRSVFLQLKEFMFQNVLDHLKCSFTHGFDLIIRLILAAFPLGRWQQKPFPQPSSECPSWWLWGTRWINPPSRPHNWNRDQSSVSVCSMTTLSFSLLPSFLFVYLCALNMGHLNDTSFFSGPSNKNVSSKWINRNKVT